MFVFILSLTFPRKHRFGAKTLMSWFSNLSAAGGGGGGGGGGSYFPYILLNEIQTMFSQLAKRSARVLPADLVLIMRITSKSIDQRSREETKTWRSKAGLFLTIIFW